MVQCLCFFVFCLVCGWGGLVDDDPPPPATAPAALNPNLDLNLNSINTLAILKIYANAATICDASGESGA